MFVISYEDFVLGFVCSLEPLAPGLQGNVPVGRL